MDFRTSGALGSSDQSQTIADAPTSSITETTDEIRSGSFCRSVGSDYRANGPGSGIGAAALSETGRKWLAGSFRDRRGQWMRRADSVDTMRPPVPFKSLVPVTDLGAAQEILVRSAKLLAFIFFIM